MKTAAELMAEMDAIITAADARPEDQRALTDDEVAQYAALETQLKSVNSNLELRSRHAAYRTPVPADQQPEVQTADDEVNERAFEHYMRTGQKNSELVEVRAQGVGTPSAGGYLAPDGFRARIVEKMKKFGGLITEAEQLVTTDGNPLPWPTFDDTANEGEIVAESGTGANGADMVFGTGNTLGAYKYWSFGAGNLPLRVPFELAQDSAFDIGGKVESALATRIRRKMAKDAVRGTGSGQPLGIDYTGTIDLDLASGNAVTYAKLVALTHKLDPAYRELGNCKWLINDTTLGVVESIVDGNGRPILQRQADSGAEGAPSNGRLLGYPVVVDQAMPDIANGNDAPLDGFAIFGDLRLAYVWRSVKEIVLIVDPYSRAKNGEVEYIAWARADGTVQDRNAFAILGGYDAP